MKLCKDCKHNRPEPGISVEHSKCVRPEFWAINRVSGEVSVSLEYSSTQRKFEHLCGEDAQYFEAKPVKLSLWQCFKNWCLAPGTRSAGPGGPTEKERSQALSGGGPY